MIKLTVDNSNKRKLELIIAKLLSAVGENPKRIGLKETPRRVAEMYEELLSGYEKDPKSVFKVFDSEYYNGLVIVSNIYFFSLCEHHLIPFFGKIHIGYVPNGKILGLSKFARLVEIFSKRLQVQERLTKQINDTIVKYLHPLGVIVFCEAEHLCMTMRGVKKNGSKTITISKSGVMETNKNLREEFFMQITHKKSGSHFI